MLQNEEARRRAERKIVWRLKRADQKTRKTLKDIDVEFRVLERGGRKFRVLKDDPISVAALAAPRRYPVYRLVQCLLRLGELDKDLKVPFTPRQRNISIRTIKRWIANAKDTERRIHEDLDSASKV
jgi:hypothetical protein